MPEDFTDLLEENLAEINPAMVKEADLAAGSPPRGKETERTRAIWKTEREIDRGRWSNPEKDERIFSIGTKREQIARKERFPRLLNLQLAAVDRLLTCKELRTLGEANMYLPKSVLELQAYFRHIYKEADRKKAQVHSEAAEVRSEMSKEAVLRLAKGLESVEIMRVYFATDQDHEAHRWARKIGYTVVDFKRDFKKELERNPREVENLTPQKAEKIVDDYFRHESRAQCEQIDADRNALIVRAKKPFSNLRSEFGGKVSQLRTSASKNVDDDYAEKEARLSRERRAPLVEGVREEVTTALGEEVHRKYLNELVAQDARRSYRVPDEDEEYYYNEDFPYFSQMPIPKVPSVAELRAVEGDYYGRNPEDVVTGGRRFPRSDKRRLARVNLLAPDSV